MSSVLIKIKGLLLDFYYFLCRAIFGYQDAVVFESFGGKMYGDNCKPVSEELHKLNPNIKIVWFFKKPEEKKDIVPDYVICVSTEDKWQICKWSAIARAYVSNCILPSTRKGKKQFFVQLWHGDRPIKRVIYDIDDTPRYLAEEKDGYCNLAVAGSDFGVNQYRTAFRYNGEVINFGSPRNDCLVNLDETRAKKIRKNLGISKETKVLLYAPTLRDPNWHSKTLQEKQDIDLYATLKVLEKKTFSPWICLTRSHPAVIDLGGIVFDDKIINATNYEDMADLLMISDMVITDYSTSASDYVISNRPAILYQSDIEDYMQNSRSIHFNMDETPYFIAKNQKELEDLILGLTEEKVEENCKAVLEFYGANETGRSSYETAKRINDWIIKK